jgi:hypothetical protein
LAAGEDHLDKIGGITIMTTKPCDDGILIIFSNALDNRMKILFLMSERLFADKTKLQLIRQGLFLPNYVSIKNALSFICLIPL